MNQPEQVRIGSTIVRFLGNHRFVLRDMNDSTQVQFFRDEDVPALIHFLFQWSKAAQSSLRIESKGCDSAA
jgi:hypothetical protein